VKRKLREVEDAKKLAPAPETKKPTSGKHLNSGSKSPREEDKKKAVSGKNFNTVSKESEEKKKREEAATQSKKREEERRRQEAQEKEVKINSLKVTDRERETRAEQDRSAATAAEEKRRQDDEHRRFKEAGEAVKRREAEEKGWREAQAQEDARRAAHSNQQPSPLITCNITKEARAAVERLQAGTDQTNAAALLKCNVKSGEVELQQFYPNTSLEKVGQDIPDGSPRFIVYKHFIDLDGKTRKTLLMFVYYNPVTTNVQLKKTYTSTKDALLPAFTSLKSLDITSLQDLTDSNLRTKMLGKRNH